MVITVVNISITNREWYFLHVQMEEVLKKNPDNHIAKDILVKLVENCPSLDDIKSGFKHEYESIWMKD